MNSERSAPATIRAGRGSGVPLLIDMDRALLRSNLLLEAALAYATAHPCHIFRSAAWLFKGKAHLRRELGEASGVDAELLPVWEDVVGLAEAAKQEGRKVFLITRSDAPTAQKIAERFGFVDGVISVDPASSESGRQNLAGIRAQFPDGYDYIGGGEADAELWDAAREVVAVAPDAQLRRKISAQQKPVRVIEGGSTLHAIIKAARLHQWAKNTLIFVPAILSGTIFHPAVFLKCVLAFLALGLVALGTYLVNDLLDVAHDRRHWSKRFRPIAAGELPIPLAMGVAALSIAGGLAIGGVIGRAALAALALYLVLTLAYSVYLKRLPILDVVVLAVLFTLRLAIGIAAAKSIAAQVYASPWLLVFSMSMFTSLSIAKRYTEIRRAADRGDTIVAGRGYLTADAPLVLGLGLSTGIASVLILVLYLIFDAFNRSFYGDPRWLWAFPVIIFLWIGRIWLLSQRGELNDDPVAFALKDRQSLMLGALMAAAFAIAWISTPF